MPRLLTQDAPGILCVAHANVSSAKGERLDSRATTADAFPAGSGEALKNREFALCQNYKIQRKSNSWRITSSSSFEGQIVSR